MIDFSLQQLVLRLCALLFIVAVHGLAVAATAVALGDPGPRQDGRLTLNPFAHLDILGGVSALLFSVGWIRPIAIDAAKLRPGRAGLALAVIAGAAATLLSALALRLLRPMVLPLLPDTAWALALRLLRPMVLPLLPDTASALAFALVEMTGKLSVWFALLNLLPVPSLTGSHLLMIAMPQWGHWIAKLQPFVAVLLAVLAATGWVTGLLAPAYRVLAGPILGE